MRVSARGPTSRYRRRAGGCRSIEVLEGASAVQAGSAVSRGSRGARIQELIEAHNFVPIIACCRLVTLKNLARSKAPGPTPRAILEKFATLQMVDIHVPTTDGAPSDAAAQYPAEPPSTSCSCVNCT